MKFRGEFKVENLHYFVGCLMSLGKLALEHPDPMSALLRITKNKISIVTKTVLHSEAFFEMDIDELFHSPYLLEGNDDGTIALNVSVNSLYETLNASVNSEYASLKLKRNNQMTSLSVTFPDPALPSISITLDIAIIPTEEYNKAESLIPEIPPCTCNIGLTKFQSIICYLESANKIGNEFTEFEVYRNNGLKTIETDDIEDVESTNKRSKLNTKDELLLAASNSGSVVFKGNKHSNGKDSGKDDKNTNMLLKLKSPGLLAELETTFHGMRSFPSHSVTETQEHTGKNPKTVLSTESVYNLCKNAIDSIIFNKHEALLVAAIPDDYESAEWTFFVLSVTALNSCQIIFMIPNHVPVA
ncbi:hypothetical protein BaOVIS_000090 [Babesia ovis]|uniref:Uncharacterized protein n=1 Tax=Babesia ovis TaxID=5869 RepID=A0A9W5WT91_BABOV|nr:hypothetical protein BaOVIS_000090 [Babesia ovis]